MNRSLGLVLSSLLFPVSILSAHAGDISYSKCWIRSTVVHVVTANLNSPNVKACPAISRHGIGSSEGFGSMLGRLRPTASITGTFFCTRSLVPVGHIVIDGRMVNLGSVGTGVCFAADNTVDFIPMRQAKSTEWTSYAGVIRTGPRLVHDGVVYVNPRSEGFHDGGFYRPAQRTAIGITKSNKLLLVTVSRPIYLGKLAAIMRDLGAVNAVNLDGGSSTAMSYRGRILSHPGRRLTNLIVLYESKSGYESAKSQLVPSSIAINTNSRRRS